MVSGIAKTKVSISVSPRHGHVFQPESRAYFAWVNGNLDPGALNQLEAGKFFPETQAGLRDPLAPTDEPNNTPPADGQIASGGNAAALFLDEPRTDWQKHEVQPGATYTITWDYSARHLTRRWKYFITREEWQPEQPLSRAQFEDLPFYQVELAEQPHWECTDALMAPKPTVHNLILPTRTGYHVLLAIWEVANTGNAFYQVLDLDFAQSDFGENTDTPPARPTNLRLDNVQAKSVSLSWTPAMAGTWPVMQHKIYRDGNMIALIEAGENLYIDNSVLPTTKYKYSVRGVDSQGNDSLASESLTVVTPSNSGNLDAPPTAPLGLYTTEITSNTVSLAWLPSVSSIGVVNYIIYRDGKEIGRTSATQLNFIDSGLTPATRYRYIIAALDYSGQLSVPGTVLAATTLSDTGDVAYAQWSLDTAYSVGDKAVYKDQVYTCLQAHTAHPGWEPDVTLNVLWALD